MQQSYEFDTTKLESAIEISEDQVVEFAAEFQVVLDVLLDHDRLVDVPGLRVDVLQEDLELELDLREVRGVDLLKMRQRIAVWQGWHFVHGL